MRNCPFKYKYELVDWFVEQRGWKKSEANMLEKRTLYAIWYRINKQRKER